MTVTEFGVVVTAAISVETLLLTAFWKIVQQFRKDIFAKFEEHKEAIKELKSSSIEMNLCNARYKEIKNGLSSLEAKLDNHSHGENGRVLFKP